MCVWGWWRHRLERCSGQSRRDHLLRKALISHYLLLTARTTHNDHRKLVQRVYNPKHEDVATGCVTLLHGSHEIVSEQSLSWRSRLSGNEPQASVTFERRGPCFIVPREDVTWVRDRERTVAQLALTTVDTPRQ